MRTWLGVAVLGVLGAGAVTYVGAAPRGKKPAKPSASAGHGAAGWDGVYVPKDPGLDTHSTGLLCPGDGANHSEYVVRNGVLEFDVKWTDEEGSPHNGDRSFHVAAPLVQADAKATRRSSSYAKAMATVSAKVPIEPLEQFYRTGNQVVNEAHIEANFSVLAPQGHADQAVIGSGRAAFVDVFFGPKDDKIGNVCGATLVGKDYTRPTHETGGADCSKAGRACTNNLDCCSRVCGSQDAHNFGHCE